MINLLKLSPFRKNNETKITIDDLVKEVEKHHKDADLNRIRAAYEFAKRGHGDQKRKSGEPFIEHPLNTAYILAKMEIGENTIVAALLHDLHEDTNVTLEEIQKKFGVHIATLVDGVTKLGKVKIKEGYSDKEEEYFRNLRKMFISMSKDIRVILIKLADRLHNMETLAAHSPEKQVRIARETMEIYAPIANRLGMGEIKGQLEDLAFTYLHPQKYQWLVATFQENFRTQQSYIEKIQKYIKKLLDDHNITVIRVEGRAKHLYSLYKKLKTHDDDISKIYDLIAVRIIVEEVDDCYRTLGILHQEWKPLVGRIKDYIATPKPNGYRSLHTTLFAIDGKITEFQIRTKEMHREAEFGIAAHWMYADKKGIKDYVKRFLAPSPEEEIRWVQQLSAWKDVDASEREKMIERLKIDYFNDRIFIYTPKGDVRDLPIGATVIDFAYTIHTDVGHQAEEAIINGKQQPLETKLRNGDVVEIVKDSERKTPRAEWLEVVVTEQARQEIQKFISNQDEQHIIQRGRILLAERTEQLLNRPPKELTQERLKRATTTMRYESIDSLLKDVGSGKRSATETLLSLFTKQEIFPYRHIALHDREVPIDKIRPENEQHLVAVTAPCCKPKPGDEIAITNIESIGSDRRQATIHAAKCREVPENSTTALWINEQKNKYYAALKIITSNNIGLLRDIADALNDLRINIEHIRTSEGQQKRNITIIHIGIGVQNLRELKTVVEQLEKIHGVRKVRRS